MKFNKIYYKDTIVMVKNKLVLSAKRIDMNDGGYVQVLEPEGEGWAVLAEAPVGDGENMVIPFIPGYGNIRIAFWGRLRGLFYTICDQKQEWVAEEQLVTICDEDKDKYRWGFNGIEKVNEVAGIGNHYQALYGDYSSRTGFRWNLDPKATPGISPYAMFRGNPIWYSDPQLDTIIAEKPSQSKIESDLKDVYKKDYFEFNSNNELNFTNKGLEKLNSLRGYSGKNKKIFAMKESLLGIL